MCEETVPFYMLLAATMFAAGFDPLVGAAIVLLGAGVGLSLIHIYVAGVMFFSFTKLRLNVFTVL